MLLGWLRITSMINVHRNQDWKWQAVDISNLLTEIFKNDKNCL